MNNLDITNKQLISIEEEGKINRGGWRKWF
jgi:hypothetical protein